MQPVFKLLAALRRSHDERASANIDNSRPISTVHATKRGEAMPRNEEYLYTIAIRIHAKKDEKDQSSQWDLKQIRATSIIEVSRELATPLDDLKYISKELLK